MRQLGLVQGMGGLAERARELPAITAERAHEFARQVQRRGQHREWARAIALPTMTISITLELSNLCIALLGLAAARTGRWGKVAIITFSIVAFGLIAVKAYQDNERDKNASFLLADSDITPEITATINGEPPSEELINTTPSSLRVAIGGPNEGWECIMEPLAGFYHPGIVPEKRLTLSRLYLTKAVHQMGRHSHFKYVWDLAGKDILVVNPRQIFGKLPDQDNFWRIRMTIRIKGNGLVARDDSSFWLKFPTDSLRRDKLLAASAP